MARINQRVLRVVGFALFLLVTISFLSRGSSESEASAQTQNKASGSAPSSSSSSSSSAPAAQYQRENATFVALTRNAELWEMASAVRALEDRFNRKYNYDFVFLNDVPFTPEFEMVMTRLVSGRARFGVLDNTLWGLPGHIDAQKAADTRVRMKNIIYGASESYRYMCRFFSGLFYKHPIMQEYKYYWRVDTNVQYHCDIDYDVFKYMRENKKDYGFVISIHEYKATIETLWDTTKAFMKEFPQYLNPNNLLDFVSNDKGATYNDCHFWSNMEVANMDMWRDDAYTAYFEYLDKAGGFFYERWGDAPVHSIAASLFLDRDQVHHFADIGYYHGPFHNCPIDDELRLKNNCLCDPNEDFTWKDFSCTKHYYDVRDLKKPLGWEKHVG